MSCPGTLLVGAGVADARWYPKGYNPSAPLIPVTMANPRRSFFLHHVVKEFDKGVGFAIRSPQARQPNTARGSKLHPLQPDHTPALEGRCLLQRNGSTQQQAGW